MTTALATAFDEHVGAQSFWQATLDSLPDSLVVVDRFGEILAANRPWTEFADANDGGEPGGVGANYLHVCDEAAVEDPIAAAVGAALRDVLAGRLATYTCVYPCHAPGQERWFMMQIAPFLGAGSQRLVITHHDVTVRHQAQQRNHEQAELLDAVGASIIATDVDGIITHWSAGAEVLYGWSAAEALGKPVTLIVPEPGQDHLTEEIMPTVIGTGVWEDELELRGKHGAGFPASVRLRLLHDTEGALSGVVGVSIDMTERVALERRLRGAHDFLSAVTHAMADGLFVLDADGMLTLINEAAEGMLGWSQAELLGKSMHDETHALTAAGAARPPSDRPFSIGLEPGGKPARIDDDVLQCRDGTLLSVSYSVALFTRESGEQGCVVVFNDVTEQRERELLVSRELEALSWVGRIRDALADDRLVLYAQPIVDVVTGETVQHELLVRLIAPNGDVIAPGTFLPVAEAHGLIREIDRRVVELAMVYAAAGHRIEVNLSADSISDPSLFRFVQGQLEAHHVDAQLVVFEITETALIGNESVAQAFIEKVRGLDCGVALDDFGTGYGSFRYLKHLPVTTLKIDQEFVRDLDGGARSVNRHVIQATVTLARGMGQKTIAEGVETESALAVLRDLGVDYAQGYHFARPAPADEVFSLIKQIGALHA